jgi:nucleoside-diphosphate-sugar epimerase
MYCRSREIEAVLKRLVIGKIALVTGAAQGIGEAIARKFASEGAFVIGLDRQRVRIFLSLSLSRSARSPLRPAAQG